MMDVQTQLSSDESAQPHRRSTEISSADAESSKVPKRLGMCAFFRPDQFPSGVYSVAENLMRGFAALRRNPGNVGPMELTVFHRSAGLRWTDEKLRYREFPSTKPRFVAEARVGLHDSAGLD